MVFITSAWGLGEMVVQGAVNPDEFYVHKPTLAAGRPAIVRRTMGSKKIRMVYAPTQSTVNRCVSKIKPQAQRDIFSLSNEEVQELAKQAVQIEKHYGRPMDIEWAKDGHTGKLFIVGRVLKPCGPAAVMGVIPSTLRGRSSPKGAPSATALAPVRSR